MAPPNQHSGRNPKPKCTRCKVGLEIDVNWRQSSADICQYICKPCSTIIGTEKRRRNKEWAIKKLGGKCYDCKQVYPRAVYDFHHVDMSAKEYTPSTLFSSRNKLEKELENCILLCANCHRLRHSQ